MRCTVSGEEPSNPDDAPTPTDETRPDGQKSDHWVMCPGEIIKAGFKRPVRRKYQHVGIAPPANLRDLTPEEHERYDKYGYVKYEEYGPERAPVCGAFWTKVDLAKIGNGCGVVTSMPVAIAETYAANPGYYGSTFCCGCGTYLPVGEFVWNGTQDRVGT